MDIQLSLIHNLLNCETIEQAHNLLKMVKGTLIERKIYYSAVLYKFSDQIECTEELKLKSKDILLKILQNIEYKSVLTAYVSLFDEWKNQDKIKLIQNLSFNYYNLKEILRGILKSPNNSETDNIWVKEITTLENKLLSYINKLKGNELHQQNMIIFESEKELQVAKILDNAFWKLFEENIENNDYEMLIKNYQEMKIKLLEISKDRDVEEYFDAELLSKSIISNDFKVETLISMTKFICNKLLQHGPPALDRKIADLQDTLLSIINEQGLTAKSITLVFKNVFQNIMYLNKIISAYRYMY